MSKKSGCLFAFLVFILFLSFALNLGLWAMRSGGGDSALGTGHAAPLRKFGEKTVVNGTAAGGAKIVQIDLDGIISSMSSEGLFFEALPDMHTIKRQIEQAVADANVKAIVLRINSPGGEVTASDVLYNTVKKAAATKPVIVHMDSMAASGGYYVACGATKIVASETTLTASIGVIIETLNYSDLFGKVGLGMQTFTSGAFKDSLSGARPMRDDEKAYVQNLVNQMYERFLGIVSEARKVPADQLRNTVADGRVVTGREALAAKLVDQIGYIEDAYTLARDLGKAADAPVVRYHRESGFLETLLEAAKPGNAPRASTRLELSVGGTPMMPRLQPGVPYYLSTSYAR